MIPILSSSQIQEVDQYTIKTKPIPSIELMEDASKVFCEKFVELYAKDRHIYCFAGIGNNGGDALAIARLLKKSDYEVSVYAIGKREKASDDFTHNLERLGMSINFLESEEDFPKMVEEAVVIDGLFGSGLSRPIEGLYGNLVKHINDSPAEVVSIDIASGLYDQHQPDGPVIEATHTITFQVPKLAFFQPGLSKYVGQLHIVRIGLSQSAIYEKETSNYYLEADDIAGLLPERAKYAHKGDAGRVQLVVGGYGKIGAAILASRAAMRSGCGLLFCNVPQCGIDPIHIAVPEAMVNEAGEFYHDKTIEIADDVDVVGIGPGLGTNERVRQSLERLLSYFPKNKKLVLDADAINIVAENKDLLKLMPPGTILTPHPGEFKRLVGNWADDFEKIEKLRNLCKTYSIDVVLKGAHSAVCNSRGTIIFNCSGNPGMATAGSGDVLFGMICGLLSQGITPEAALIVGVYLHGAAGDVACQEKGEISLVASDIIENIPNAIKEKT